MKGNVREKWANSNSSLLSSHNGGESKVDKFHKFRSLYHVSLVLQTIGIGSFFAHSHSLSHTHTHQTLLINIFSYAPVEDGTQDQIIKRTKYLPLISNYVSKTLIFFKSIK
jgi:hypothetical protein